MDLIDLTSTSSDSSDFSEPESDQSELLRVIMGLRQKRLRMLDQISLQEEPGLMSLLKQAQDRVQKQKKRPVLKGIKKTVNSKKGVSRKSKRIKIQELRARKAGLIPEKKPERKKRAPRAAGPPKEKRKNVYGPTPGIEIGHQWNTRLECSHDGVHRPTIAGIHPGPLGAYSIALSGGYPEDVDEGDTIVFTGAGGRDLKGITGKAKGVRNAPQIKDQELNGANLSLIKSLETGVPVRLIRGSKLGSVFAPPYGYRYDGLYRVVQYCYTSGYSGFRVFRFRMCRVNCDNPPWRHFLEELANYEEPPSKKGKLQTRPFFPLGGELDLQITQYVTRLCEDRPTRFTADDARPLFAFPGWNTHAV